MKNCIKFLSLFMSIIMMMAIVGCGKKTGKTDTNDDFFTDAESQTVQSGSTESPNSSDTKGNVEVGGKSWEMLLKSMPKNLRGTTVTVVNWNPMSEYTGATTAIKTFEKQTGIKVDWQTVDYGVYLTRLATMVASGKSPDVVRTRTPDPAWLQSFQSLDAAQYDFSDDAWDKTLMKDYTVKGVTYATSLNNTHLGSVTLLFYNKDLISKYDYEDPYKLWKSGKWTMNKFIEMCRQYKKDAKDSFPCTGGYWETWTEIYGVEGPVGYDGTKYYSNLSNSKFLTVTQNVADLYISLCFVGRAKNGTVLFHIPIKVFQIVQPLKESHNNISFICVCLLTDNDPISVLNTGVNHRIAVCFEQKEVARAEHGFRQLYIFKHPFFFGKSDAAGNRAIKDNCIVSRIGIFARNIGFNFRAVIINHSALSHIY